MLLDVVNRWGNLTEMLCPGANSLSKSRSQLRLKYSATSSLFSSKRRMSIDTQLVLRKALATEIYPLRRARSLAFCTRRKAAKSLFLTALSTSSGGVVPRPLTSFGGGGALDSFFSGGA